MIAGEHPEAPVTRRASRARGTGCGRLPLPLPGADVTLPGARHGWQAAFGRGWSGGFVRTPAGGDEEAAMKNREMDFHLQG